MYKKNEERMDKNKRNEQVYAETETETQRQRQRETERVTWCFTPNQPVRFYQGETH